MTELNYVLVDAFTRLRLQGNPVAVFVDADGVDETVMQCVAREMNLSETTFVSTPRCGGDAEVRIFTPVNELAFAGHPILGTGVALCGLLHKRWLRLETRMGIIPLEVRREDDYLSTRMEQPVPTWEPFHRADELLHVLGVARARLPIEIYRNGPRHVVIVMDDVRALSAVVPDHRALSGFPDMAVNCVARDEGQWRNRMFSPAYGVVEDAATGSAAGPIAIHLARYGLAGYDEEVAIRQGVEIGRPSLMRAVVKGSKEAVDHVMVMGDGTIVGTGRLMV